MQNFDSRLVNWLKLFFSFPAVFVFILKLHILKLFVKFCRKFSDSTFLELQMIFFMCFYPCFIGIFFLVVWLLFSFSLRRQQYSDWLRVVCRTRIGECLGFPFGEPHCCLQEHWQWFNTNFNHFSIAQEIGKIWNSVIFHVHLRQILVSKHISIVKHGY